MVHIGNIAESHVPMQLVKLCLMETTSTALSPRRELPIVGGHVALDFANTVDDPLGPARYDHASTYEDVVRWSVKIGILTPARASRLLRAAGHRASDAAAAVERAHELREILNDIFGGVADGRRDWPKRWTKLRPFVANALAHAMLDETGRGFQRWVWRESGDLTVVLHPIAVAAADLLVSDELLRVKRCARCPWLFLDKSKNRSRRWCDMNDCGKAQKIERYVARRAAARRRTR
jgi:predicted RNA-binding Zn ribbon-like protein